MSLDQPNFFAVIIRIRAAAYYVTQFDTFEHLLKKVTYFLRRAVAGDVLVDWRSWKGMENFIRQAP